MAAGRREAGESRWLRLAQHLLASRWRTRRAFTPAVLADIEQACRQAEAHHAGEIRFVIETTLPFAVIWRRLTPRDRALQLFAHLRLWDTHHNNGVLIYVLMADRAVEIVADRGISTHVKAEEWQAVCRDVERHYRVGRYAEGSRAAVSGVARLLARHFPSAALPGSANELPDQPILL